jgi:2-aminoadipate transaminase
MNDAAFDLSQHFTPGLPAPAPRFTGLPKYHFVGGNNDPVQIPCEALAEAAAAVLKREGSKLAMYHLAQGPQGYEGLRSFVASKLLRRGITCGMEDVIITSGSNQGIDLVVSLLAKAGDTVMMEEFTYGGALSRFRKLGFNVVGAKLDEHGLVMDALEAQLAGMAAQGRLPRFIYTIPTIQNPTGSVLPLERRHRLIALAKRFGVPIFEDECYTDLTWVIEAPPALYALDPSCVIHIGSFSKSLAPALRLGYITASWPVLAQLLPLKGDAGTGAVDQMVVAEYFSKHFDAHLTHLNKVLAGKLAAMQEAIAAEFGTAAETWTPLGGIFLWFRLPDAVDVRRLIKPAADAGIAFNPGPEWAVNGEAAKSHLRLCFAMPSIEVIRDGVAALARVCREQTGIPAISRNVQHGTTPTEA